MRTLFLLAHQDDEIAYLLRISSELSHQGKVSVVYLTDGQGKNVTAKTRNMETLRCLESIGVSAEDVYFLGSEHHIPDAKLVDHIDRAFSFLMDWSKDLKFDRIYTLAWEGGHQDHDATHLIALAMAKQKGLESQVYEASLYQGFRCPKKFFRMFSPLRRKTEFEIRTFSLFEAFSWFFKIRFFPSQKITWMALGPLLLINLIFERSEIFQRAKITSILQRPHEGLLLYEAHGRMTYEQFCRKTESFQKEHLF